MRAFLKDIQNINYDRIVFGGDIFGYYYGAKDVISILRDCHAECILGNHDEMLLKLLNDNISKEYLIARYGNSYKSIDEELNEQEIDFVKKLPRSINIETDGLNLLFVHGSIDNPTNGRIYPDKEEFDNELYKAYDYVFMGHTHHKMIKRVGNCILVNPGSIGQQRDGKGCSYVVSDAVKRSLDFKIVEFDVKWLEDEIDCNERGEMQEKLKEVLHRV